MKTLLPPSLFFLLSLSNLVAETVVADFGLSADYDWSNRSQHNYGFSDREETDTSFAANIGGYAQTNWDLSTSLDLSAHESEPLTLLATLDNALGVPFRIYLYDESGNLTGVEFTESFSGGIYINQDQWNNSIWDAFDGKGSGAFDWSTVVAFGFRTNASDVVRLTIDKIVLGEVTLPEPQDGEGNGSDTGSGEIPPSDPIIEPWSFVAPPVLSGPTLLESINVTEEFSVEDHDLNASDWASPTASHLGAIFYAFIDPDQDISVMAHLPDGTTESTKVMRNIPDNNHHVEPSLGVDKHGFLHLVGNMHNGLMQYYRSVRAMDVSEWTFLGGDLEIGGIEGRSVTYPSFFNAPDGTLFAAFRSGVVNNWTQGRQSGAIGRYDVETGRWTMLGARVPKWSINNHLIEKTVVWDDSGSGDNRGYQGYKLRCVFSPSGRLHMSWNVAKNPDTAGEFGISANHTHVMYAYSDDQGETWHEANGNAVEPPLGTHNMTPIYVSSEESLYNSTAISFSADDRGIVGQYDNSTKEMRWWIWDGQQWADFDNRSPTLPGLVSPGPYGTLTAFSQQAIYRSWDSGETWKMYKIPATTLTFETYPDINFFRKTGMLRYSENGGDAGIITLEFSATPVPTGGPLTIAHFDPPTAAFGRDYASIISVGGGDGDYQFSIVEGNLPPGLSLSADGLIHGVPAELGEYSFTVAVQDNAGNLDEQAMTLPVGDTMILPLQDITASHHLDTFPAEMAADGASSTRWSTDVVGAYLLLDLGNAEIVNQLRIDWTGGDRRSYTFSVECSHDLASWTTVFEGSSELSPDAQVYTLAMTEPARYLRVTGSGSSFDERTNINEIAVERLALTHLTPWPDAILSQTPWSLTWLGWLDDQEYPFVNSFDHGWLYVVQTGPQGAWCYNYQDDLGWIYLDAGYYSLTNGLNLYHPELGWLLYYADSQPRWFHRLATGEDFRLPPL